MREKAGSFCVQLERAERVFGYDDAGLIDYLRSLAPIAQTAPLELFGDRDRLYLEYLANAEPAHALAVMRWLRGSDRELSELRDKETLLLESAKRKAEAIEEFYATEPKEKRQTAKKQSSSPKSSRRRSADHFRPGKNPRISVIVPVYNVEPYLEACLNSIRRQTLRDIEIVCVDDAGNDGSKAILHRLAGIDNRVRIIAHSSNMGLAAARNSGLAAASGEYVIFVDSDDLLARDESLATLYRVSVVDNSDETIGGLLKWAPSNGCQYLEWHSLYAKEEIRAETLAENHHLRSNVVAVNKLIRRSFLEGHGIRFNEGLRKFEDNPFSCRVHVLAERISVIPHTTYVYRQRDAGSIMSAHTPDDISHLLRAIDGTLSIVCSVASSDTLRSQYQNAAANQILLGLQSLRPFLTSDSSIDEVMAQLASIEYLFRCGEGVLPERLAPVFRELRNRRYRAAWEEALKASPPAAHPAMRYSPPPSKLVHSALDSLQAAVSDCEEAEKVHDSLDQVMAKISARDF
jgi:glycosyltransferase involved in cell wall biosynthesis